MRAGRGEMAVELEQLLRSVVQVVERRVGPEEEVVQMRERPRHVLDPRMRRGMKHYKQRKTKDEGKNENERSRTKKEGRGLAAVVFCNSRRALGSCSASRSISLTIRPPKLCTTNTTLGLGIGLL